MGWLAHHYLMSPWHCCGIDDGAINSCKSCSFAQLPRLQVTLLRFSIAAKLPGCKLHFAHFALPSLPPHTFYCVITLCLPLVAITGLLTTKRHHPYTLPRRAPGCKGAISLAVFAIMAALQVLQIACIYSGLQLQVT